METEIEELSKQENNLKEYLIRNAEIIRNWKNEVESKINAINNTPSGPSKKRWSCTISGNSESWSWIRRDGMWKRP